MAAAADDEEDDTAATDEAAEATTDEAEPTTAAAAAISPLARSLVDVAPVVAVVVALASPVVAPAVPPLVPALSVPAGPPSAPPSDCVAPLAPSIAATAVESLRRNCLRVGTGGLVRGVVGDGSRSSEYDRGQVIDRRKMVEGIFQRFFGF